ncbi:hypothetical protein TNCV_4819171 [Trichonephila clavipes]|nr:hypothetical protein TNCV_4819171 [Trichonephila clavipes]
MCETLNIISLSICRTICESCWTALAMSSRVANHLPCIGSLILGMRSKSQGEQSFTNSSHPQRRVAAVHTLLYVIFHYCAGLLHCPQDEKCRMGRLSRTLCRTCRTRKSL